MKKELRTIIVINESRCNGCGLCVSACHEGAIALVGGSAKLMHEHYCDGLGDCLPACPTGAISFEQRIADAYDEEAVHAAQNKAADQRAFLSKGSNKTGVGSPKNNGSVPCSAVSESGADKSTTPSRGCPGAAAKVLHPVAADAAASTPAAEQPSQLRQWPVQIKLVSVHAPYFDGAHLLIAADCAAFAYGAFHREFMAGKVTLIGCPKLDSIDYTEKLSAIIAGNNIASVTVARMEVPCCGGIEQAAKDAVQASGKAVPLHVATISTDGRLLG